MPLNTIVSPPRMMSVTTGLFDLSIDRRKVALHDVGPVFLVWVSLPQISQKSAHVFRIPKDRQTTPLAGDRIRPFSFFVIAAEFGGIDRVTPRKAVSCARSVNRVLRRAVTFGD